MPLDTRVPATIETIRLYLLKDQDDSQQDDRIFLMANSAIARMEAHLGGRPLVARDVVETHSGKGLPFLFTIAFPIVSIASVSVDGAAVTSTYTYHPRLGHLQLTSSVFAGGVGNVTVALRAGFELVSFPPDLLEAFLAYTKWLYDEKETGTLMATSVTVGPTTINARFGMPETIKLALNPYRDTRF